MKFSVIIPAYNESGHIANAIKSILAQDAGRRNFEVIVADNNSTDETSRAAREAGADKVVLETEQGTNMARNAGYKASKGEIIVFMDADCIAPPDWLSRIGRLLENSSLAMVSGPYDYGFSGIRAFLDEIWTGKMFPKAPALWNFYSGKKRGLSSRGISPLRARPSRRSAASHSSNSGATVRRWPYRQAGKSAKFFSIQL